MTTRKDHVHVPIFPQLGGEERKNNSNNNIRCEDTFWCELIHDPVLEIGGGKAGIGFDGILYRDEQGR